MQNLDFKFDKDRFEYFKHDKKFIDKFCDKYNISLITVTTTIETGKFENMYFFNDGSGGYTLDAIKKSL